MLVIRKNRVGRKNRPQYRIVVQEKSVAPGGRHIAVVGSYDPHSKVTALKKEEIQKYISNGAQPSDSVHNLLVREGVIDAPKRVVKVPEKKVEETEETIAEESADTAEATKEESADAPTEEKKED